MPSETPTRTWPRDIYDVFKKVGVEQIAYVPDAGHAQLIRDCEADNAMAVVSLTTEEEGVAMLAGGWLGGKRGALLMQSSGVGNCINMLSVVTECRFPLLMIVTMRGEWGEFNPWQLPMGQSVGRRAHCERLDEVGTAESLSRGRLTKAQSPQPIFRNGRDHVCDDMVVLILVDEGL